MQIIYDEIVSLTDEYCSQKLNEEYGKMCRQAIAAYCVEKGQAL